MNVIYFYPFVITANIDAIMSAEIVVPKIPARIWGITNLWWIRKPNGQFSRT